MKLEDLNQPDSLECLDGSDAEDSMDGFRFDGYLIQDNGRGGLHVSRQGEVWAHTHVTLANMHNVTWPDHVRRVLELTLVSELGE